MYMDVIDLRDFYYTALGQVARRTIRQQIRTLWPDVRGRSVAGLGYATPFLRPFLGEAERVFAVMPARQGVTRWPRDRRCRVALAEDTQLPLEDASVDRILLVHSLEATENVTAMLEEAWRVLAGQGRLLAVVPNRRSLWAQIENTPFGHGHPYSGNQLSRLLRANQFVPERTARCLYMPPLRSRFLIRTAPAWEKVCSRWFDTFAGVVLVEASKQVFQTPRRRVPQRRRLLVPLPQPAGVAQPARTGDVDGTTASSAADP